MRVHLAFNFKGINHSYHLGLWRRALTSMSWRHVALEDADLVVMWGPNPPFDITRKRGKPVLMVDFPYWNRGGKHRDGNEFYKVSLNGQHPTPYIMKENHSIDRYRETGGSPIQPWRAGGNKIMLAGMGMKASRQNGHNIGAWEARMAKLIRSQTSAEIIYRPKPRQETPKIPDTTFDDGGMPIEQALQDVRCMVCHHGNPTVTALQLGIHIFMNGYIGAASHFASFDFTKINEPVRPDGREQFFNNIAHWQWSPCEIESGQVFRSYLARGLLI